MLTTIKRGKNKLEDRVNPDVRSAEQHATVEAIANSAEFAFACMNPFPMPEALGKEEYVDLKKYRGYFWFPYYTDDDVLHVAQIEWDGRISAQSHHY